MKKILIAICVLMMASTASASYSAYVHLVTPDIVSDSVWGIPVANGIRLDSFLTIPGGGNWKDNNKVFDTNVTLTTDAVDLAFLWRVKYATTETTFAIDNITTNILADTLRNPQIDTLLLAADSSIFATSALGAWLMNNIGGAGGIDSSTIADIVKYYVWQNISTTGVDSSAIGDWLIANIGGSGGATVAQFIDSMQTMAYDDYESGGWMEYIAVNLLKNQDSLAKIIDSMESIATLSQKNLDSIKAVLDSVRNLATITDISDSLNIDSLLGFAADANTKVKVPILQGRDSLLLYDTRWDSVLSSSSAASFLDKIWNIAFSTGFTAGSMGDSLNNASYMTDSAEMARAVWNNSIVALANRLSTPSNLPLDSAATSRLLKRVIFGIPQGSGSDSVEIADRKVTATASGLDSATTSRILKRVIFGLPEGTGDDSTLIAERLVTATASGLDSATTSRLLKRILFGIAQGSGSDSLPAAQRIVSLAAGQYTKIGDTCAKQVWNISFGTAFTAGSMGDSLNNASYVNDSAEIARAVWNNSIISLADRLVTTSGGGLDSGTVARIVKRLTWGLPAGSGDDSTTLAQRLATLGPGQFDKIGDSVSAAISGGISVDTASIARSVWDNDVVSLPNRIATASGVVTSGDMKSIADTIFNRMVADTVHNSYLAVLLRTSGLGGRGLYTRYIVAIDSAGTDSVIIGAPIWINNLTQSSSPYLGLTNSTGKATFQLDTASWVMIISYPGYMTVIDTITVAGTGTDTIWTYNSGNGRTTIYGDIMKPNGSRIAYGIAEFQLIAVPDTLTLEWNDTILTTRLFYDTADVQGHFSVELYNNSDISDSSYYRVIFKDRTGAYLERQPWYFIVPDSSSAKWVNCTKWR